METFTNILNFIWSFLNSIWIPIIIAIVGAVYFAVAFRKASRIVDKRRTEVQQKIVNNAYGDYMSHKYKLQSHEKSENEPAE